MRVLVSGSSGGLGRSLIEAFSADAYDRKRRRAPASAYDLIIHAAFNTARHVPSDAFGSYTDDTVGLTEALLAVPHRRFVFISSVDVYPPADTPCREDDVFDTEKIESLYGRMKLICEEIVRHHGRTPLIVRPTAMLGPYIRRNSLMRVLFEDKPQLTLSEQSRFNYILHNDVAAFIRQAVTRNVEGVFNLAAGSSVTLGDIARLYKRDVAFGAYVYGGNDIDNAKASFLCPELKYSSLAKIETWLAEAAKSEGSPCLSQGGVLA